MKLTLGVLLSVLFVTVNANAYVVADDDNDSSIYVNEDTMSYQQRECSDFLYQNLNTMSSKTDVACTRGRTDVRFQDCTIYLTKHLNSRAFDKNGYPHKKNVIYAAEACLNTNSFEVAMCASELFLRGGLYVSNPRDATDAMRICNTPQASLVKNCVINKADRGQYGVQHAMKCVEEHDPIVKERKERERRRIEEEKRRAAEQARLEEQRRQQEAQRAAEQRRIEAQREAQRRADEQRRLEEQRRQSQTQNQEQVRRQEELRKQEEARKQAEEQKRKQEEDKKKQSSSTGSKGSSSSGGNSTGSTTQTEEPGVIPPPPTTTIDDLPAFEE
ncbi:hypothetical protein [Bdellovibrio bacteriovorus]|uniref:hypothetical protein n=1 Tax=Bdellovibrio bacteriovorus TaxID=959 RepID=UPI0035A6688C